MLVCGEGDALFGTAGDDRLKSLDVLNGSLSGGPGTDSCRRDARERSMSGCP